MAFSSRKVLLAACVFVVSVHGPASSTDATAWKKSKILRAGLSLRSSSVGLVKLSKDLIHVEKSTGSTSKYLVTAGINDGHSVTLGLTM